MEQINEKLIKAVGETEAANLLSIISKALDNPEAFKKKLGMIKMFLK